MSIMDYYTRLDRCRWGAYSNLKLIVSRVSCYCFCT